MKLKKTVRVISVLRLERRRKSSTQYIKHDKQPSPVSRVLTRTFDARPAAELDHSHAAGVPGGRCPSAFLSRDGSKPAVDE